MKYEELIQSRQSIRSFYNKALSAEQIAEIKTYFEQEEKLISEIPVAVEVCTENAGVRLEGVVGYMGNAFFAPAYIVLLSEEKDGYLENAGFIAEGVSLKLVEMGLSSCWLTVDNSAAVKKALLLDSPLTVTAVLACGYGVEERDTKRIDIVTPANVRFEKREGHIAPKIAQGEMVYEGSWGVSPEWKEDQFDPYLDKALYAATLAPSFLNRQTYRYLISDRQLLLCETREEMTSEEDRRLGLGATMFNFQMVYTQYNTSGHRWKLGQAERKPALGLPEGYELEASYQLW